MAWREPVSQREAAQAVYQDAIMRAAQDRDAVQRAILGARTQLAEAERVAHAARQARSAAESAGSSVMQRLKAVFGAGELGRLRRADRAAELQRITASEELQAATAAQSRQAAAMEQLQRESQARDDQHAVACTQAANEAQSAAQKFVVLRSQLDAVGLAHANEDELASRARLNQQGETRLGHLAYLEDRWFQLTGLAGTSSPTPADRERSR